jgi:hypothetical protein
MKPQKLYYVEFKEMDVLNQQLSPEWYKIPVHATSFSEAAKKAVRPLIRVDIMELTPAEKYFQIWYARVVDALNPGKHYSIIRNGGWVIDVNTGRKNKALEERLDAADVCQGQA